MKPIKQIKLFFVATLYTILAVLIMFSPSWAATYYVDATNGNNSNDGNSPPTAWKTIAKVNSFYFLPGDYILFKRGEIWREQLRVPSSGSVGNPISFRSYGSGGNPIISGADVITTWDQYLATDIYLTACTWTTKQVYENSARMIKVTWDTNIATTSTSMSAGTWTLDDDNDLLYVWATDNADPDTHTMTVSRRTKGIAITDKSYITISDIATQYANGYGIAIDALSTTTSNNIIDGCTVNYNYISGILAYGSDDNHEENIKNCVAHDNGKNGISLQNHSVGSVIEKNTVYDNGTNEEFAETNGILIFHPTSSSVTVQDNIVYTNGTGGTTLKGNGIGLDSVGSGCIVRRNISHVNNRFGIMVENSDGVIVHHNIVYGNAINAGIAIARSANDNLVYNNTVYNNHIGILVRGTIPSSPENDMTGNLIKNNIFFENATRELSATYGGENDGTYGSGNVYDHNCFGPESSNFIEWGFRVYKSTYDDWETANGATTNSIEVDPLMTDPGNADFTLMSISPCIDAGVDVGLTEDYRGRSAPTGHGVSIGGFEYQHVFSPKNLRIIFPVE